MCLFMYLVGFHCALGSAYILLTLVFKLTLGVSAL